MTQNELFVTQVLVIVAVAIAAFGFSIYTKPTELDAKVTTTEGIVEVEHEFTERLIDVYVNNQDYLVHETCFEGCYPEYVISRGRQSWQLTTKCPGTVTRILRSHGTPVVIHGDEGEPIKIRNNRGGDIAVLSPETGFVLQRLMEWEVVTGSQERATVIKVLQADEGRAPY